MEEKEERIVIKKQINYHPPYGGWRGEGKEIVLTRQEAIERMAKAIFNYYTDGIEPQNWKLKEVRDNFNKVAEAALNALLSDGEKVK
jgi:hypothetical protein